jgi:hypothetical protein
MGTLCRNCPVRNIQKATGEPCTIAFATRYGNSCVNLDITEHMFKKELEEFSKEKENEKKTETPKKERKPRTTKKKETIKAE